MIKYFCDCCGASGTETDMARLEPPPFKRCFGDVFEEYHLCNDCFKRAIIEPILEVGKKYRARDRHGNIVDVEIAEMTRVKNDKTDKV